MSSQTLRNTGAGNANEHLREDSPPYLHDGSCLTLEATFEFVDIVLSLQLNANEKTDLVAYLRQH